MVRNILLFDHRDEADPGNLPIKYNIKQIKDIIAEISSEKVIEVSIIEGNGGVDIYRKIEKAHLVIAHFESSDIEKMLKGQEPFLIFPKRQIVVLVTTQSPGFPSNAENMHTTIQVEGRERVILFTMNMEALEDKETFKRVLTLSFEDAVEIVNGKPLEIFRDSRKDPFPALKTKEILTGLFIFCMGYLSAGVGAGEINDEEVKILIGWNDKVKEISPNTEADWKAGWEKVKNPLWWDDLEKINNLKEKVRIEMDGNLDEHLEKLIDFIKGKGTIEHLETVKTVLKMLKEKIWS